MPMVDAVVTAGGIPKPGEPLYPLTQGRPKALLDIGGRPMVQWVLDALGAAATVRHVVVAGVTAAEAALQFARPLGQIANQGGMIDNAEAGVRWVLERDPAAGHVLVVSGDIPTITPEVVDWIVTTSLATDHDVYYSVIPSEAMERRFPGSHRSFFRLKDGRFTGSDMNMFRCSLIGDYHPAWRTLVEARKNALKQAQIIGLGTLLLFATGQLTIADGVRRVGERLGVRGRAIICPHAEAGMDVDKPNQYDIVRRDLEGRGPRLSASAAGGA